MNGNGNKPTMEITCQQCATVFKAVLPPVEVMNGLYVSMISGAHKHLIRCTKCSAPYIYAMTGGQVQWGVMAATPEMVKQIEGSPIIQPTLLIPKM